MTAVGVAYSAPTAARRAAPDRRRRAALAGSGCGGVWRSGGDVTIVDIGVASGEGCGLRSGVARPRSGRATDDGGLTLLE
ncbi:hypothetical protein Prubr_71580 [Polymorphospora rubra]|uniref:Uncharacterized protein n=1 Tax=Polymorphospora rubra TaxID=338584 RepID=A0A810NA84_9ACTN|nr:hypothetical protein Prubr_71580 [Polymorphospora rubra]